MPKQAVVDRGDLYRDRDRSWRICIMDDITLSGHPPRHRSPWGTVEGRVISLVSRKGGVGKTTSAVNLGAALALSGHTVLIIGTDPQCGVCRTLSRNPEELDVRLVDLFNDGGSLLDLSHTSCLDGLHFVTPGISSLEEEEEYLENLTSRADDFIAAVDHARNFYDTILMDCPPNLGPATRAALLASDSFLVPVQAEELCRGSLDTLLEFVDTFRDRHFPSEPGFLDLPSQDGNCEGSAQPLELEGFFLTMVNERTRMGQHVTDRMEEDFGGSLFSRGIPRTTRLSEMALLGRPAVIYDRLSKGSRAYFDLADELVDRYRLRSGDHASGLSAVESCLARYAGGNEYDPDENQDSDTGTGGGLDGFLAALGGASVVSAGIPAFEEPPVPEMVSLDELLAEEEAGQERGNDDWDEEIWPHRPRRLN
jgi:chromosome partitioning protein